VKCRNPGNPANGHMYGDTYSVGSQVTFSCEKGFQLTGVTKLTCMESGEWSHSIPYCEGVVHGANADRNVHHCRDERGKSRSLETSETVTANDIFFLADLNHKIEVSIVLTDVSAN